MIKHAKECNIVDKNKQCFLYRQIFKHVYTVTTHTCKSLNSVGTVNLIFDVTVVYTNDSLDRVCVPTVEYV